MEITVDLSRPADAVALREPDDFKAFKVTIDDAGRPDQQLLAELLRPYGRFDGEHAFITRHGLRALAGERAHDPGWQRSLDGMLRYAETKGWLDESGAIQAHCERRA